ncbi:cadmium-translocating P-type ATPase [Acidovorax sp. HDW3]|uniref:heavy metal translocating P-type ATPase n=1 Tax=Acidovorax sp. HDW3 TaxID=2714923 RepID=UPI00140B22FC|nr:cation-translocating P-type ATPase [Acidovorax sp. HDW3]QIL43629.1 cadmium-translocating P-type ATPase [Acidovorax sp. HDW3]
MSQVNSEPPAATLVAAAAAPIAAASLLDDPQEWAAFGRQVAGAVPEEGLWDSQVVLQGMHCAACALTIEEALRAVPGVQEVQVSAATQRARVQWRPAQVLPSAWMAAVQRAGYQALPAMDAQAREQRQAEQRKMLWRWLVAGLCMMQVMMYAWPAYIAQPGDLSLEMETLLRWASWVLSVPVIIFSCGPFFSNALRDVRLRRVSMDLPVALGMLITFVVSTIGTFEPAGIFGREVFFDSLTMFVFFLLTGRWLELRLRERTAGALEALLNRLPDSVERQRTDGGFERVAVRRLAVGDVVRVLPGDAFPADGSIIDGQTQVDEALLTGESTPVWRTEGARVAAGSYNLQAAVLVRVDGVGEATRYAQIVRLMESAALQKPRLAQLADRVARPFLLAVLLAAGLAAAWWWPTDPGHALMVAVAVLIVTCPCALSLATPVAMLTAAGTLARHGVLVRNLQALEALATVDTLVFDKTGTLTRDGLVLQAVRPAPGVDGAQALAWAAGLAQQSLHPVARAVLAAWQERHPDAVGVSPEQVQESIGQGLQGLYQGRCLRLGSPSYTGVAADAAGTQQVVLAELQDGTWQELARFDLHEDLRPEAAAVVRQLQQAGVQVQLLSGDRPVAVQRLAQQLGIAQALGGCTPADKLARLQAAQAQGHQVAMVGDGLNDGPVLAGAHVSFAFGCAVPLAQARSDFVVLGAQLTLVAQTLLLARRTLRVVRQNLWWAALYNALAVPLAVLGWMPAWLAGLGMAASSLLVVLNAARLSRALAPLAPASAAPVSVSTAWEMA